MIEFENIAIPDDHFAEMRRRCGMLESHEPVTVDAVLGLISKKTLTFSQAVALNQRIRHGFSWQHIANINHWVDRTGPAQAMRRALATLQAKARWLGWTDAQVDQIPTVMRLKTTSKTPRLVELDAFD